MADPTEDGRAERAAELHQQIEQAFNDPNVLGMLRQHVITADLDEGDRTALASNIEQYLVDHEREHDIGERRARGDIHGDPQALPPRHVEPDPEDADDDSDLVGTEWAPR